jgi:hypothetical protein
MAKYTVEEIKKQALDSKEWAKNRRCGSYSFTMIQIRNEINKVLFLVKEIEKLRKKVNDG